MARLTSLIESYGLGKTDAADRQPRRPQVAADREDNGGHGSRRGGHQAKVSAMRASAPSRPTMPARAGDRGRRLPRPASKCRSAGDHESTAEHEDDRPETLDASSAWRHERRALPKSLEPTFVGTE
jgi:hypothetical protein